MDNNKLSIKVSINTTRIMLFIWFVGYLFTSGYVNPEVHGFWETALNIFMLVIGWPMILGAKIGGVF